MQIVTEKGPFPTNSLEDVIGFDHTKIVPYVENDLDNVEQKAWQIGDPNSQVVTATPLQLKKEAVLFTSLKLPKLSLTAFKEYSFLSLLLVGFLHITLNFFLIVDGIIIFSALSNYPLSLLTKISLFIPFIFVTIMLSFLTTKLSIILKRKDEEEPPLHTIKKKKTIYQVITINLIQLVILAVSLSLISTFFEKTFNSTSVYIIITVLITTTIIGSVISLPFRIAKILAALRDSGLFQNLADAFQFSKLSLKKQYGMLVSSMWIPGLILSAIIYSASVITYGLVLNINVRHYTIVDIIVVILGIVLLTAVSFITTLEDVAIVSTYEKLIREFSEPPDVDWIKDTKDETIDNNIKTANTIDVLADNNIQFDDDSEEDRGIYYCPKCSSPIPEGVNFCVVCGYKVR